ncbi:MAG: GWxTD domain-containing protein [bacterium]|nr:GWxTD domain-containing protein [bacterium]
MRHQVHKEFTFLFLLLFIFCGFLQKSFGQSPYRPLYDSEIGTPKFSVDTKILLADVDSLLRFVFFVNIPYQNLQYQLHNDQYVANFIVSCEFTLKNKVQFKKYKIVKHWQDSIVVNKLDSDDWQLKMYKSAYPIDIPAGKYQVKLRLRDRLSDKFVDKSFDIQVNQSSSNELYMTELMFVKWLPTNYLPFTVMSSENSFYPTDTIYVFYQVKPIGSGTIKIREKLISDSGKVIFDTAFFVEPNKKLEYIKSLLPKELNPSNYQYIVQVEQSGVRNTKSIGFRIIEKSLPLQVNDLTLAIRQLKYILEEEQVDQMLQLPYEQQLIEFKHFWEKRDPTPDTPKNERMEEYYKRIEIANQRFTKLLQGWESDRGKIYIIYGEPTDIEEHHFVVQGRPYEIWYYSHLQLRFTFVDYDGFGEYKLVTPLWD